MQYQQAYDFVLKKLETGLPSYLSYHNTQHTKNVIAATEYIAQKEDISGDELLILKTAALFHDMGFLQDWQDHEMLSCKLAQKHLPDFGYSQEEIEKVNLVIMATKLPQSPVDHLGKILADADLFYLGGDEYLPNAENLYKEFKRNGTVKTQIEWNVQQAEFITNHHYFTKTAIREREEKKQKNLQLIQSKLGADVMHHSKMSIEEFIKEGLLIIAGVIISGFALKCFLVPNRFFDGGVTGVSLLLHEIYGFSLPVLIALINIPLIIVSIFSIGKRFAIRTFISVLLLSICLQILPDYSLTSDKLLICIFGGVFLGIGIGLAMRGGAALDGSEVLAVYTLKRTSFTITEIILAINIIIFTIAAFKFGIETSLYSILTYFAATRSIDYVVEGLQAYTGVTIISGKSEVIKYQLVNKLGRGITVYKGERGFLPGKFDVSSDCDIIFTVITRLELRRLKNLVAEVDPKAFVFSNTIKEATGGILKRRHSH